MFGLGLWEIVIIALVALLVLGPERLPKVMRQITDVMRDLRRAANDLQHTLAEAAQEIEDAVAQAEIKEAANKAIADKTQLPTAVQGTKVPLIKPAPHTEPQVVAGAAPEPSARTAEAAPSLPSSG